MKVSEEFVMEEQQPASSPRPEEANGSGILIPLVIATFIIVGALLGATAYLSQQISVVQAQLVEVGAGGPGGGPENANQPPRREPPAKVDSDKLIGAEDPANGPADAAITIVEYSDYECPFCGRFYQQTLPELKKIYGEQIRWVFKDFPLPFHGNAQKAHEAAHCAGDQNKYWPYHDLVFENQKNMGLSDLKAHAAKLNLDAAQFEACLSSDKYAERVQAGIDSGREFGVSGTPTFFVNGRRIVGALPASEFKRVIDAELKN